MAKRLTISTSVTFDTNRKIVASAYISVNGKMIKELNANYIVTSNGGVSHQDVLEKLNVRYELSKLEEVKEFGC